MENEFIPYEQALALKELGFDEPCLTSYNENGKIFKVWENEIVMGITKCSAPLYQQAFRWFREKYKLSATLVTHNIDYYEWHMFKNGLSIFNSSGALYNTYEKAELACLNKLIQTVENGK